jgi:conjugative transfer signal peptidase TraF
VKYLENGSSKVKYVVIAALTVATIVVAKEHIRRNVSDSLPVSFAWVDQVYSVSRGDMVELCPPVAFDAEARSRGYVRPGPCPGGTIPFLKLVAARSGDVVRIDGRGVSVNGRLLPNSKAKAKDRAGRKLDSQPLGTQTLPPGYVWLYGTNVWSADSRYYGRVSEATIHSSVPRLPWGNFAALSSAQIPDLQ